MSRTLFRAAVSAMAVASAALTVFAATPGTESAFDVLRKGDARAALRVMDSLSLAPNVSGWSRARALKVLGDHRFIKEDYKGAAEFYDKAAQADTATTIYKHLNAMSLAMDDKAAQAADIWRAIAANKSDPLSAEAAQLVAQLNLPAPTAPQNRPTVSDATPKPQASAQPSAPAQQQPSSVLTVSVAPLPTQAAPTAQQSPEPVFTVQVGAFGAKENADNLAKRLSGEYKDVTVSPTTSGEATLYRVRVGSFKNKDEATQFADNLVTNSGLSARVVEK